VPGTHDRVSTTYAELAADAKPGDRLLIDDGRVGLEVVAVEGPDVVCTVTVGGAVSDNKGLSLPGMDISVPALSAKDIADLEFALGLGVDLVALSFVRSPADIDLVHAVMDRVGHRVPVIAKLEKPEAVDDIEAVVDAFDGLMVARGDLGVEMPLERVPLVQKRAIQRCREKAKPVIVATQMLDSMIVNPRPTRAEASDVANAVLDGADAVMLSGETSVGAYPVETVQTMARIIEEAESDRSGLVPALREADHTQPGLLAQAALAIGDGLDATALVTFTLSGNTVRRLAWLHPRQPLVALTPVREVRDQLALSWGTRAVLVPDVASAEDMVRAVDEAVLAMDGFARGDVVVIVAGAPPHTIGVTDLLRVRRLGDDIA
jgi:pyruvate kinase